MLSEILVKGVEKKGRELNWPYMHIFQSYVSMFTQES